MASVNTNAAAITALRTLQNTNHSMDATQNRISTGYKIGEAKDNAAYWAISTTLKSDNKSLSTVKDALGLGASTVDTAYQGLNKAKDVLDEIKSKLTAATQDGVDRDTIQNEIKQLQDQLKSIATSSVFSGENWLSTDTSSIAYNANKQVVASFSRDSSGAVNIGTIGVDISKVALFDASTAAGTGGIVDGAINLKGKDGRDLSIGGTDVTTGNTSKAGLDAAATTVPGGMTAGTNNNQSVVPAAAALNAIPGGSVMTGTATVPATAATNTLNGTFAGANLDQNDAITLVYKTEGGTNQTVSITRASTAGASGTISSVANLVDAANTALGGSATVKAVVDTNGKFALQRWNPTANAPVTGAAGSVEVVSWTGVDPTLTSPVSITAGSAAAVGGQAAQASVKTITITSAVTNGGDMTFKLDGTTNPITLSGFTADTIANTAAAVRSKLTAAAISGVTIGGTGNDITITYSATGPVSTTPTLAAATTNGTTGGGSTIAETTQGFAAAKASSSVTLGTFGSAVTLDDDDKLKFTFSDGATAHTVEITRADVTGTVTAGVIASNTEFRTALNNALTRQGLNTNYAVTLTGSTLKVEALTATTGQSITIDTTSLNSAISIQDTDSAATKTQGLSAPTGAVTGTNTVAATAGTTATTLASTLGSAVTAGDTITVSYMMDGTAGSRTLTVGSGTFDAAAFATAWAAGTSVPAGSVPTVANSSGTLTFSSSTQSGTSSFTLVDATLTSSAATGSRIKNENVLTGLTSSKAASVKTAALTWTGLAATDKVTLNLSADGTAFGPVTVNAGASVDDFVTNLNADTTFNTKLVASKTVNGELLLTSKTTGAASAASLTSVAFADAAGTPKTVLTTNFGSVTAGATATTAAFSTAVTLDDDDNLYFKIQVDQATAPTNVTIDKALINKALSTASTPVTNGTIATAADFKKVVDAALAQANVKGVATSLNGTQLTFSSTNLGPNSKLLISDVSASQGGDKISLENMDISSAGLAKVGATTSDQIKQVLSAYIDAVNTAITKVTSAAAALGSVASRIDLQKSFVDTLMDTIDKGVGNLIDADMSEESTKLQALQVKQQLGVQALSIANQASQSILSLFRS